MLKSEAHRKLTSSRATVCLSFSLSHSVNHSGAAAEKRLAAWKWHGRAEGLIFPTLGSPESVPMVVKEEKPSSEIILVACRVCNSTASSILLLLLFLQTQRRQGCPPTYLAKWSQWWPDERVEGR